MARYVDGFVLPVPRKNLQAYRRLARKAGRIWREHGALQYVECVGEDLAVPAGIPFPKRIELRKGEVLAFSWILYRSRAHRDRVNAKVMADPRMDLDMGSMPFDIQRMSFGGFEVLVEL